MAHRIICRYVEKCNECEGERAYVMAEHDLGHVEAFITRWCACSREQLVGPAAGSRDEGDPEPS